MRTARLVTAAVIAVTLSAASVQGAEAQTLQLTSPFPDVEAAPGQSMSFDVYVFASVPRSVKLEVVEAPEDWETILRGGGFVVTSVFADIEDPPEVTLEVRVPPDARPGPQRVVMEARSGAQRDVLDFTLRVSSQDIEPLAVTTDQAVKHGRTNETFEWNLTVENNTPDEVLVSVGAEGPPGWSLRVEPVLGEHAAAIRVQGGGRQGVDVLADPPPNVEEDRYTIVARAQTPEGRGVDLNLTADIGEGVRLAFRTFDERLSTSARPGSPTQLELEVANEGSVLLRNVFFTASPPQAWSVTFEPSQIDRIEPGDVARVTTNITPQEAVPGDYMVTLTVQGDVNRSLEVRVSVRSSRFWEVGGLLLIMASAFTLRAVFRRYGRR